MDALAAAVVRGIVRDLLGDVGPRGVMVSRCARTREPAPPSVAATDEILTMEPPPAWLIGPMAYLLQAITPNRFTSRSRRIACLSRPTRPILRPCLTGARPTGPHG